MAPRERGAEERVHAGLRIADGHRIPGVAMVAAADRDEVRLARAPRRVLELHRHLHRHLNRDGTRVGVEDVAHRGRRDGEQQLPELDRRRMGEPAEHDVRHRVDLRLGRRVEDGMVVAVDGAPPRRHAVHELAAVLQLDRRALRAPDGVDRQRIGRRRVGMPEVTSVELGVHRGVIGRSPPRGRAACPRPRGSRLSSANRPRWPR